MSAGAIAARQARTSVWARLRDDPGLRLAVVVAIAMRAVLGAWALMSLALHGSGSTFEAHVEAGTADGSASWPLVGPWERWDGLWYLHIASTGYPHEGSEAAFAPLFPLLTRTVAVLFGGDVSLGAWVVVTVALVAGLWATWHLVDEVLGPVVARRTVIAIAVYPGAFFLLAPYPEGLFLALSCGALLAAHRRAWAWAGVLTALAVLCRPQGAALVVALAVEGLAALRAGGSRGSLVPRLRANGAGPLFAVALPAAALGAWFLYCRLALGLALGPLTALRSEWGHHFAWPWQVVGDSLGAVSAEKPEEIGNLIVAAAIVALLPLMARRLPASWAVYAALALCFSLFNEPHYSPLMSLMRYAAVLVPVFAAIATLGLGRRPARSRPPERTPWWAVAAWVTAGLIALACQGLLVDRFVHHLFVA